MKIAYLGPAGTFSQQAAQYLYPDAQAVPFGTIEDALDAVSQGECIAAAVPLENSTEGAVNATLDALLFDYKLSIKALLPLPIHHCLMAAPRVSSGDDKPIAKILSHPQSLGQCKHYIRRRFPSDIVVAHASSNAEAARQVSESDEPWAAIGPVTAAAAYNLRILEEDIQDHSNNITLFVLVTGEKPSTLMPGSRASLAFSTYNKPGELYRMLGIFDTHQVNMTKIISRPMKSKPGEYVFFVDIDDYLSGSAEAALAMIESRTPFYKFLGSYPVIEYNPGKPAGLGNMTWQMRVDEMRK